MVNQPYFMDNPTYFMDNLTYFFHRICGKLIAVDILRSFGGKGEKISESGMKILILSDIRQDTGDHFVNEIKPEIRERFKQKEDFSDE